MSDPPVLYTFRRCPYAMRARMALAQAEITFEVREVLLKEKPPEMLAVSPKGTVPVMVLPDGRVIDESLEIMRWALEKSDPAGWLSHTAVGHRNEWLEENDGPFKLWLDRYKYADRYPEHTAEWYREQAMPFLSDLNRALSEVQWLHGDHPGFCDIAIFPFIRQFSMVDSPWFESCSLPFLRSWLSHWLESPLFSAVMARYPRWKSGMETCLFSGVKEEGSKEEGSDRP